MRTIIVFVFLTVASSRNVQYDHTGEIAEVLKDTFGLTVDRTKDSDEENYSFEDSSVRQSKMFDMHSNHRQVTIGPEAPFGYHQYDKHWHRHDHRGGGNRHVNCEDDHENNQKESTISERNYNMETTQSPINRKTELNMLRPKNNTTTNKTNTHLLKVNPVTKNVTETTEKTVNNGQIRNTTKVSSNSRKITIEENRNVTGSEEVNKGNTSYIDGDRWIWVNGSTQQLPPNTTTQPTTVGLGDRAAFAGDGCATGQVKVGNLCVDED